jgi:hypothetical protein
MDPIGGVRVGSNPEAWTSGGEEVDRVEASADIVSGSECR